MINLFIQGKHDYTVTPFIRTWPNRASTFLRRVSYKKLHRINTISKGIFIFSDIDRLSPQQKNMAEQCSRQIKDGFGEGCVLNYPGRVLGRYDLLMQLWRDGVNRFRVYRRHEWSEQMRFPVFLRRADDHKGSLTGLIGSREALDRRLKVLKLLGIKMDELIAVEFCDARGRDNLYRKYSAFRIGDRIIPGHIIFSRDWVTKDSPPEPIKPEENSYLEDNPHRDELMAIFRVANIEYGRIDYGLLDGMIQVWEINTNPVLIQKRHKYANDKIPFKQQLVDQLSEALLALILGVSINAAGLKTLSVDLIPTCGSTWHRRIEKRIWAMNL